MKREKVVSRVQDKLRESTTEMHEFEKEMLVKEQTKHQEALK